MRNALLAVLALFPLVAVPLAVWAQAPDPVEVSERLTAHLGVTPDVGDQIAAIVVASHEQGHALRDQIGAQAEALRTARADGDEAAMIAAMAELQHLSDQAQALQHQTRAEVIALLDVDQQAAWTLHHLQRRAHHERIRAAIANKALFDEL